MTWPKSPLPNSVYIPNEADKRLFGIDVSGHQGAIDFTKMSQYAWPKIRFIAARATISWGYKDAWFKSYWRSIKEILSIPRAAYAVLYPLQSVARQVTNFAEQFDAQRFDGDIVVPDIELDHGASRAQITTAVIDFTNRLRDWAKKPAIVYSRFTWVQQFMDYQSSKAVDFIQSVPWWMAQYLANPPREDNRALVIPNALKGLRWNVVIHQTGEKAAGSLFGVSSAQLDTNRWLLGEAEFYELWGITRDTEYPGGQPQPMPVDVSAELAAIREAANRIEAKINQ